MKIIRTLFFVFSLCSCLSCIFQGHNKEPDFVSVNVDEDLFKIIGGIDNLKSYQLYLSDTLSLYFQNTIGANSNEFHGNVQFKKDKYTVSFPKNTPGVLKEIIKVKRTSSILLDTSGRRAENTYYDPVEIDVFFDKSDASFLRFYKRDGLYLLDKGYPRGIMTYPQSLEYEGQKWFAKNNVFLVIHIDKKQYENLYNKNAQGRTL